MTLIAVTSLRGAPGCTTVAVELTRRWPTGAATLVEADPDGGCIAAREALGASPGLAELVAASRGGFSVDALDRAAQPLMPRGSVVVASPAAEQTCRALRAGAVALAPALARLPDRVVVADIGRLRPDSPALPFASAADMVLLIMPPTVDAVASARARAELLGDMAVGVVLSASSAFGPAEITAALGCEVVGALPRVRDRRSRRRLGVALDALAAELHDIVFARREDRVA